MPRDDRYNRLEKALTEARTRRGLTQQQVATALGRPQSFVSKYESGERGLDVVEFLDVCTVLGIDPMDVIAEIGRTG
ncbi:helix-turn-helix domain-containing protein [Fulvimonas soli]|jgi:transcriptional regulator with XRE-family HTH domain|uniref:helix-turn-helix domain-containing protein n=1 Tax=Fulvimonas soli TaxID=155197 RepID=UPI000D6C00C3|nr:helix-turn-helix transcriptional regulator [Fulvimonas soli]TNY28051.1 transcriptional regulator [Fulvimonas soli]HVX57782.1 helix-turn-helix transcriptional regulator [Candidatus Saccharimonadales bacterium]